MPSSATPQSPSLMEILQAVQMMNPQQSKAEEGGDKSVTKVVVAGITTLIGAVVLALILWVGSSVSNLSTAVTKMSANVDQLQKSISDLQQSQGTASAQLADGKATDARQDARMDAVDADINRMKERLRIVEGQKPVRVQPNDG